jgi:hypothetical protein
MILPMNDNDEFDVDLAPIGAKIDDTDLFHKDEAPTLNAVNKFISTKHEFKNQAMALSTSNLYVEYKMLVNGKEHYSGIHTTKADLQTYNIDEMIISFPTDFIYWCYKNISNLKLELKDKNDTNYIATGFLIPIWRICELLNEYKSIRTRRMVSERLKNLNKTLQ